MGMKRATSRNVLKESILGKPPTSAFNDLRVTFITPSVIASKGQIKRAQPPLGIACLAGVLEEYGFNNIQIIDSSVEGYDNVIDVGGGFIRFGLSNNEIIKKLLSFKPDIIAISALFSSQMECTIDLSREIKENIPHCIVCLGGIHATERANEILSNEKSIDYIIGGEADYAFTLFCIKEQNNACIFDVPGLSRRDPKTKTIVTNPQLRGLDMNELPMPAWHLMDMEMYHDLGMPHNPFMKHREYLTIMTERGCPEKCYFCASASFFGGSGRFRPLTAQTTYEMFKYAREKFGIREIQIEDDTFTLNYKRVLDICKKIKDFKMRITLPNAIRADAPINHAKRLNMYKRMSEAGFEKIAISAEHGDQSFLNNVIGKRLQLSEVTTSVRLAHEAGLLVHVNFMMGFPFETAALRQKTIDFSQSLEADSYSVSLVAPLPGTTLWSICEKNDLFMPDFDVNRLVYDVVNIRPHDISPTELKDLVVSLNSELNARALKRSKAVRDHYKLFAGKSASGDRKYSYEIDKAASLINSNDLKFKS